MHEHPAADRECEDGGLVPDANNSPDCMPSLQPMGGSPIGVCPVQKGGKLAGAPAVHAFTPAKQQHMHPCLTTRPQLQGAVGYGPALSAAPPNYATPPQTPRQHLQQYAICCCCITLCAAYFSIAPCSCLVSRRALGQLPHTRKSALDTMPQPGMLLPGATKRHPAPAKRWHHNTALLGCRIRRPLQDQ